MNLKTILSILSIVALTSVSVAQTVTVAKSGTPDHSTVQAAIDSFDPDPNAGVANVIQITDDAVYDEVIEIDVPVTIEGTGVNRPVLAVQTGTTGNGDNGIGISIPTGDVADNVVVLRNLIVIPSLTNTPANDGIRTVGQNLDVTFDNIVITANDGSDAPVTLDGLTEVDLSGATPFGDDGCFVGPSTPAGAGTLITMVNTVISHNNNGAGGGDGIVCSGSNEGKYLLQDGCVISYNGRLGIQVNSSFEIDAPTKRVLVLGNKGFAGVWCAGTGGSASPVRTFNGLNVIGNGTPGSGTGWGIEQQNGGSIPFTLSNSIVAFNQEQGILIGAVGTDALTTLQNVTVAGTILDSAKASAIETDAAHTGNVTMIDCVVAGNGSADPTNTLLHNGTGTMDISFSSLVGVGPYALAGSGVSGTGTVNQASVITDNPSFAQTNDPTLDTYFQVTAQAYQGAGSASSDLSGGGTFNLVVISAVQILWDMFE